MPLPLQLAAISSEKKGKKETITGCSGRVAFSVSSLGENGNLVHCLGTIAEIEAEMGLDPGAKAKRMEARLMSLRARRLAELKERDSLAVEEAHWESQIRALSSAGIPVLRVGCILRCVSRGDRANVFMLEFHVFIRPSTCSFVASILHGDIHAHGAELPPLRAWPSFRLNTQALRLIQFAAFAHTLAVKGPEPAQRCADALMNVSAKSGKTNDVRSHYLKRTCGDHAGR